MKNLAIIFTLILSQQIYAGGSTSVGPENPSSRNCIVLGGSLVNTTIPDRGEYSFCRIDEWKLFRAMDERGLIDYDVLLPTNGNIGMANPASVNCSFIGGESQIESSSLGEAGVCLIGAWDLFRVINTLED